PEGRRSFSVLRGCQRWAEREEDAKEKATERGFHMVCSRVSPC
ncbi:hypothetical protein LEMLEM_LOCUS23788, partial [Lemmus lemmus]